MPRGKRKAVEPYVFLFENRRYQMDQNNESDERYNGGHATIVLTDGHILTVTTWIISYPMRFEVDQKMSQNSVEHFSLADLDALAKIVVQRLEAGETVYTAKPVLEGNTPR